MNAAAVTQQQAMGLTSHEQQRMGSGAMIARAGSRYDAGSDVLLSKSAVNTISQRWQHAQSRF